MRDKIKKLVEIFVEFDKLLDTVLNLLPKLAIAAIGILGLVQIFSGGS
jgi:hypothetical protein